MCKHTQSNIKSSKLCFYGLLLSLVLLSKHTFFRRIIRNDPVTVIRPPLCFILHVPALICQCCRGWSVALWDFDVFVNTSVHVLVMLVHRPRSLHTRCCICAFSSSALFVSSEHRLIDRVCTSLWQSLHKSLYIVYWSYGACFVNYTEKYQWTFQKAGGTKRFVLVLVWLCFDAGLSAELDTM